MPQTATLPTPSLHAGEFTTASLAWLESRGKANLAQLVKQLVPARMAAVTIQRKPAGASAERARRRQGKNVAGGK